MEQGKTNGGEKAKRLRPFIYWTGGKSKNMFYIARNYPRREFTKYCEPFLGSGVVMLDVIEKYKIKSVLANDINKELINTFEQVRDNVDDVIERFKKMEDEYIALAEVEDGQKNFYYNKRKLYNEVIEGGGEDLDDIDIAVLFLFINRTCKDGNYRVNKQGYFTTPWNERILTHSTLNEDDLRDVAKALHGVKFTTASYKSCMSFIDEDTFVYLDPPYIYDIEPQPKFKSISIPYCTEPFTTERFIEFKEFVDKVHDTGASVLVTIPSREKDGEKDKVRELFNEYRIKEIGVGKPDENGNKSRFEFAISNY